MQAVQVLLDAAIDGLAKTTLNFDKAKWVFHFAANRRFLSLNLFLPVLSGLLLLAVGFPRSAVDSIVNL